MDYLFYFSCVSQELGIEMCMKSAFKLLEQAQLKNDNDLKEESSRMLITLGKWLNCGNNVPDKTLIKSSIDKSNLLLNFSNENLSKTNQLIREVISMYLVILFRQIILLMIFVFVLIL